MIMLIRKQSNYKDIDSLSKVHNFHNTSSLHIGKHLCSMHRIINVNYDADI